MKTTFALYLLLTASMLTAQTARLVVPIGHTGGITSLAFSPDGKFVLTGSSDKTAKLWDRQGHELQTFSGHTGIVLSVAFSPLGDRVLTGSDDGTVKCWSLDGRVMQHFSMNGKAVTLVAFSSNGQIVLAGGHGTIKRWNLDGSEIQKSPMFTNDIGARMAFSPDGNSALFPNSELKAAQHWNLTTGASDPAIFDHENQTIYAAAFSPSGKTVFTAGEGNMAILWDLATGRKLHSLIGHTGAILSIAFSPDGKKVLTGGYDNTAILWDVATGQQIRVFSGFPYTINALAFSPACPDDPAGGKYALIGGNSTAAILWEVAANKNVQTYTGHASYTTALAISPISPDDPVGGKSILIGYLNNTAKRWNLADGVIKTLSGHTGSVFSVAFAPDGKKMLTGSGDKTAKLWSSNGDALNTFSGHKGLVVSVGFLPSGDTVLTGARDQTAKLWDLHGKVLKTFPGKSDFVNAVAFSPDGQKMLTGYCEGKADLWNLAGGDPKPLHGLAGCTGSVSFSPDGQLFLICDNESTAKLWNLAGDAPKHLKGHTGVVRSAVFSPDGRQVLTGSSDQTAKLWDLNATVLKTFSGHAGAVNSVAFSPNGKWVLTCGSMDQTVKLWNVQTGDLAATLIPVDSTDWVVTTPSGLFDASPGAMRLMHYVAELEVIELDQLKERYYEPGLLARVMGFSKGTVRDVSVLGQVALYPDIEAQVQDDQLNIKLTVRSGGMGKLSFFINGKEVAENINPNRKTSLAVDLNSYTKYYLPGANTLALRAYNSADWLKSAAYELAYTPPATGRGTGSNNSSGNSLRNDKPHLYAIVIGTSDYSGDQLDLRFPDSDAKAMAEALQASGKRLFEARVHLKILTTDAKTPDAISSKKNIAAAFSAYAAQAKPTDILITYFSGHGLAYGSAEKSQFYYLTKDISSPDLKDDEVRKNYAISSEDLTQWLTANPAKKQVMILDACNSGKVVESLAAIGARELNSSQIRALDRMKDRTGMFILTGAAADKVSYEASQYGQGLLTYSLLQGMSGLALTSDKRVDVMTLFQYARDKVPELAKSIRQVQVPVLAFPTDGGSFDIGIVDAGVKIPVAQEKPVFIRNNLMNEATFFDELKITAALTEYFRQITAKGAQAEIIFVDVDQYENAYSIRGLYRINGEAVNLRGQLYKGDAPVDAIFQVSGQKDNIPALVEAIVDKVSEML